MMPCVLNVPYLLCHFSNIRWKRSRDSNFMKALSLWHHNQAFANSVLRSWSVNMKFNRSNFYTSMSNENAVTPNLKDHRRIIWLQLPTHWKAHVKIWVNGHEYMGWFWEEFIQKKKPNVQKNLSSVTLYELIKSEFSMKTDLGYFF